MVTPLFSVVIATFDRGALIESTLASVARQSISDYDVIVVSDGPAAPGLAATVASFDDRFRLVETRRRHGSQFGPNNLGWEMAKGHYIAYLGHDDIWLPTHLASLRDAFTRRPSATFVASGCIYFGPPGAGAGRAWVTGMFDPDDRSAALTHFFPPSSVAHRRDLPADMRWPNAHKVRRAVDSQFMLDAAERGSEFTSTGEITVLKFNSALRYLSYLSPDDDEQRAALDAMDDPARLAETIERAVADATAAGNYMNTLHQPDGAQPRGEPVRRHAVIRGIDTPRVRRLRGRAWLPVRDEPCAFDWHGLERSGDRTWRWSGPNTRPRLLVPYRHRRPVRLSLHFDAIAADDVRDSLEVLVDRRPTDAVLHPVAGTTGYLLEFETMLRADRPTVLELRMARTVPAAEVAPGTGDERRVGVCLSGMWLEPTM